MLEKTLTIHIGITIIITQDLKEGGMGGMGFSCIRAVYGYAPCVRRRKNIIAAHDIQVT